MACRQLAVTLNGAIPPYSANGSLLPTRSEHFEVTGQQRT